MSRLALNVFALGLVLAGSAALSTQATATTAACCATGNGSFTCCGETCWATVTTCGAYCGSVGCS